MSGEDADEHQTTKPRNIPKTYQKQKNPLLKLEKKLA
jgi:hypothetical protein